MSIMQPLIWNVPDHLERLVAEQSKLDTLLQGIKGKFSFFERRCSTESGIFARMKQQIKRFEKEVDNDKLESCVALSGVLKEAAQLDTELADIIDGK